VGNVGDSRAYWLPDAATSPALQLSEDDSFAAAQMSAGMPRKEAETSVGAHAITRWLGVDSPDDLTPHTQAVELSEDGWLLVCSDGLWNYRSDATDLQRLVHETVERLGADGRNPPALAQALTDFANQAGGIDNITVALARVGDVHTVGAPAPAPETKDTP
jgi:serine/threonine protein phosphatase PrpC